MNAPSERAYLRLVESPLTEDEVRQPLKLSDLTEATFGPSAVIYPLSILRRAFRR